MNVLELAVREPLTLRVEDKDYTVVFPVKAVAELETRLGRSMKNVLGWVKIETRELPDVLEIGLKEWHPDAAAEIAENLCTVLEGDAIEEVIEGLCKSQFPRAMARFEKAMSEAKPGAPLPNALSAAVN